MVKKKFLVLFLIIFLGLVSLNFISSEINVTQCGGSPLNTPNTIYQLNQSINATGEDCLVIGNHSIVLDCQGYNITLYGANEDNSSAVLTIPNFNNITVKNCIFAQNFTGVNQSAVGFINSTNSTIFNNTMDSGILLDGSVNANITANTINNSAGGAIFLLSGSNSSIIENNNITTASIMGISVEESPNINVSSNNITSIYTGGVDGSMIRLEDADNSIINQNTITTSGEGASGIVMEDAFDIIVDLNVITTSGDEAFGIFLDGSDNTNITSNNITTSGYHSNGINLQGTDDSIVTQNIIQTAHLEACVIHIEMLASNNDFYDNIFNTSSAHPGFCLTDTAQLNTWNTTFNDAITNIIGRSAIGGNFWTNNASTGYSDICIDTDSDYICDDPLSLADDNIDYLPLANHTNMISGCDDTLDIANKYYMLNQSISQSGTCFNITANNITLDFNSTTITGDGTGYGVNITGYNDTTIVNGNISNFSNGIYILSGSNNAFTSLRINNSAQDAILLEGDTSDDNNFTGIIVLNTNVSHYDINFSTAGIDGTWIIDISGFGNYTFAGAGGKVNLKEPSYGEIKFLEAINGSGTSLHTDVDIESNWVFVNGSKSGLNKSANISLYSISYTDPKPQYSSDNSAWTNCTTSTNPACSELSFSGNSFVFNTTHFTYFRSIESYVASEEDETTAGGLGATPYWALTHVVSDEQFEEGVTKELAVKNRMKVNVETNSHYIGVVDLTETTALINVSSDTMQVDLSVGDEARFDVLDDGFYDIYVLLNDITNNKANLTVQKIHEEIPEGQGKIITTGEITDDGIAEINGEEKDLIWLWVLIATAVIVLILVGVGIVKKRKR